MTALEERVAEFSAAVDDAERRLADAHAVVASHELAAAQAFAAGDLDVAAAETDSAHDGRDRAKAAATYLDLAKSQHQAAAADLRREVAEANLAELLDRQAALKERAVTAAAMAIAAVADARSFALEVKEAEEAAVSLQSKIVGAHADVGRPIPAHGGYSCGALPLRSYAGTAGEVGIHNPERVVLDLAEGRL